jgi:hypothetical protein
MALTRLNTNAYGTSLNLASNVTGTLPAANGGSGRTAVTGNVLQTVTGTSTTAASTSATTYQASSLLVAITPSATSSKIYVIASYQFHVAGISSGNNGGQSTIYRDSGAVLAVEQDAFYSNNGTGLSLRQTLAVLDAPSSTSEITYKIYFKARDSGCTVGMMTNNGESTITAMEVAG